VAILGWAVLFAAHASASPAPNAAIRPMHREPATCDQNDFTIRIDRNPPDPSVANGSTVVYSISAENLSAAGGQACDATGVGITFTCPGADGNADGASTVLATNDTVLSNTTKAYAPVLCVINVNPGVTFARASATFSAVIHTTDPDDSANGTKTITINVQPPPPTSTPTVTQTPTATATPTATPTSSWRI
jgi:hypothetical protein